MSAWLVSIDLQHVFADANSPWRAPDFDRALRGTLALAPTFAGRTILTRFVSPAEPSGAWIDYYRAWPFARVGPQDPLWDLVPEVRRVDAPVLTATTFGKWGADLAALTGGAQELVLTGVSTDCCVLSTALAAADAGVRVRVVTDACAGATDDDHRRALEAMALYAPLITLTSVAEIIGGRD